LTFMRYIGAARRSRTISLASIAKLSARRAKFRSYSGEISDMKLLAESCSMLPCVVRCCRRRAHASVMDSKRPFRLISRMA
jgi:hypothetical protein